MAKLLPVSDTQTFLDSLQASQIVPAEVMDKTREQFAAVEDVKQVARDLIKAGTITRWQATQLLNRFTGLVVGNYKLLDQLGVGEMGRVYLAEHLQMQRKVALKVLARKHTSQPQILRRILAEARRVAALEHAHISHIHDVNQDGDKYYIVLEYIDGTDLQRQVTEKGKFSPAQTWEFIRQAAEGLAFAHSKNVVHGGLKPSNLVTDASGNVKILDFGLAQLAISEEVDSQDSVDQVAANARLYRAPDGSGRQASTAGDMYALGATLFFLLTGKPPVKGPASVEQLSAEAADMPASLTELCKTLMAADPAGRPQDDQALTAAIAAAKPAAAAATPLPTKAGDPKKSDAKTPALKTAASLPTAKSLDEVAVKAAPPKAKKPAPAKPATPVAAAPPEAATQDTSTELMSADTSAEVKVEDNPFAGFALNTKARGKPASGSGAMPAIQSGAMPAIQSGAMPALSAAAPAPAKKGKPSAKVAAAEAAPAESAPAEDAAVAAKGANTKVKGATAKGKAAGSKFPILLVGGIGGGVLALGLVVGLVMFLMSGGDEKEIAKADGDKTEAKSDAGDDSEANPETNAGEANPTVASEANPVIATEANPVVPTAPAVETKAAPTPAAVAANAEPAKADEAKPAEPPMVASVEPKTEPKPEPPPEAKPEPKPAPKPETKVAAKPSAPKPPPKPSNPFAGFPTSVELPKVAQGESEPSAEMLTPVVLGPCKLPDDKLVVLARLLGGETACGKTKVRFTVDAANGGTALRDWEVKVANASTPENTTVIATLSAKNDQLSFQWTADAAKQATAAYLTNCALELTAGNGREVVALRQPVTVEPILMAFEKRSPPTKIAVEWLPDPKQLMFEIVNVESTAPKVKFDNKDLAADKDKTFFWMGNVETEMPLGMKLDTSISGGKFVQVLTTPQFRLEGMPVPASFAKKELTTVKGTIDLSLQKGNFMLQASSQEKDAKKKGEYKTQADAMLEPAQKANAQFEQMLALAKDLQTGGKIHYRVYLNAEEAKVVLADSGGTAPMAPEPKKAEPKKK
jgi:serine/threonine protein kinase